MAGCPSGQRDLTVNQLAFAYGGSNPSPATTKPCPYGGKACLLDGDLTGPVPVDGHAQQGPRGLRKYQALAGYVGIPFFFITALARLPLSMVPLAVLSVVTSTTGSIALAGVAAGASAIGEGVCGPVFGALSDRYGQRRVLVRVIIASVIVLVSFVFVLQHPDPVLVTIAAGCCGATLPQVGAMSRARWLALVPRDKYNVAMALEGILDEINFMVGPVLVGVVAVAIAPNAAILMPALLAATAGMAFALHHSANAVRGSRKLAVGDATNANPVTAGIPVYTDAERVTRRWLLAMVVSSMLMMGVFFGGSQTTLTGVAQHLGEDGLGAMLYGCMSGGSVVSTLLLVYLPARIGYGMRWIASGTGLMLGAIAILFTLHTLPLLIPLLFIAGSFQGPLLITVFDAAARVTPKRSGGATMALLTSCNVLGLALGAAVAGILADKFGPEASMSVVIAAVAVLLVSGLVVWRLPRIR